MHHIKFFFEMVLTHLKLKVMNVYYHQLKDILDDAGIDTEKLRNISVYYALKTLECAIIDFVKEIRYPYKSY